MSRDNNKYWISKLKNKGASFGTQFRITDRCNFKCAHCFPYYVNKNLVRKVFFQIVQYAHDKSFAMILETNGSLVT